MNIGILLAGGSGRRFGGKTAKQFTLLGGRKIIEYSIQAFKSAALLDKFLIVSNEIYLRQNGIDMSDIEAVTSGNTRNQSLYQALKFVNENYPSCKNVFIHEAARPFISSDLIDRYLSILNEYHAVITAQHITDSLGKIGEHVVNRDQYYLIQAPEAFRFRILYDNFSALSSITATCQQLPEYAKIKKIFDFKVNLKITYPEDVLIAEQILSHQNNKV